MSDPLTFDTGPPIHQNYHKGKAVHCRALQIALAFIDKCTLFLKNVVI